MKTNQNDYYQTLDTLDEIISSPKLSKNLKIVYDLLHKHIIYKSPINIDITDSKPLTLSTLQWNHIDLEPKVMKLTNTGHTVVLSAKWFTERPYLSGGPFIGNYVFSQLHFHWGATDLEGSEHTVQRTRFPLEMHVTFFKTAYLTQESALRKADGISVAVFFFTLQKEPNLSLSSLIDVLFQIQMPFESCRIKPFPLVKIMEPFEKDYFLYAGSINSQSCTHNVLWLISREPIPISSGQLNIFRSLLDVNKAPLKGNFRNVNFLSNRTIYLVNPSDYHSSTLYSSRKSLFAFKKYSDHKHNKEVSRSKIKHAFWVKNSLQIWPASTTLNINKQLLQKLKKCKENEF